MNGTEDEELDLELELEDESEPEGSAPSAPPAPSPELTDADRLASLQKEIAELKGRPAPQPDYSSVAQAIRDAASQFTRPAPSAPAMDPEALKEANQKFQEALLTDPFGTIKAVADSIADQKINAMMATQGANALSVAGDTVVDNFISRQARAAGDSGRKLHDAVAAAFEKQITAQQRASLAAATREQREAFLEQQYKMAAGEVLLKSASRARPRDMTSGGGGGGGRPGKGTVQFPNVSPREQRQLERLAEKLGRIKPEDMARIAKELEQGA